MRPCLAIDSDYLNIGIKPGMKKVPSHEILFIPTFAPSIKFIHTHFLSMGIMKDSTNKIFRTGPNQRDGFQMIHLEQNSKLN